MTDSRMVDRPTDEEGTAPREADRPAADDGGAGSSVARRRPAEDGTTAGRPAWRWIDTCVAIALGALALLVSTLGVVGSTSLSLFDEATHVDYAWSIAQGEIPYAGSDMAPEMLREWSCRSQEGIQFTLPPCEGTYEAEDYPVRGENYNYGHPPTYYGITAALATLGDELPIDITFVTAARLTGGLWLAAGLVALYGVLRTWRVSRLVAAGVAVAVASAPSIAHASSIVTNDAPAVLVGVLALWVLTRIALHDRLGWLLPAAVALFTASTKVIHAVAILAVAAVVLFMAVAAIRQGDRVRARRLVVVSVAVAGTVAAVHAGWSAYQASRATPGWVNPVEGVNTDPVVGSVVDEWLPTLFSSFGITQTFWLQSGLMSFAVTTSAVGLALLLAAAPFMNVSAFPVADARRLVGWAALLGCAAVPLLVQIQAYINSEDYFPFVSSRYALSLLPLTATALALVAHHRGWRVATVAVSVLSMAALLLSFTGLL